jgi:prepilin-type processing-associated H-X9-DG protein
MRGKVGAFTLVEILVVIGIIAILISILLPALSGARQSANTSTCANNLRRLQIASMTYATDNENFFPPAHFFLFTRNRHRWHGTRTSTNVNTPQGRFDFAGSPLKYYLDVDRIKLCPNFDPPKNGFEQSAGGYGYNAQYVGSSLAMATGTMPPAMLESLFGNRPARVSQVKRPAETILFADVAMANPNQIEYSFIEPPLLNGAPSSPSLHFRHRDHANVCWMDGHVSYEAMEWTYPTNVYGADNKLMKLGFFGPKDNSLFDRE